MVGTNDWIGITSNNIYVEILMNISESFYEYFLIMPKNTAVL